MPPLPSPVDCHPTLTTRQVAELLDVHENTVHRLANSGQLPCARTPGGHRRFARADVDDLRRRREEHAATA